MLNDEHRSGRRRHHRPTSTSAAARFRGRRGGGVRVLASTTCSRPGATTRSFTLAHRGDGLDVIDRFEGELLVRRHGPERERRAWSTSPCRSASAAGAPAPRHVAAERERDVSAGSPSAADVALRGARRSRSAGRARSTDDWRASGTSPTTSRAASSSCGSSARCSATCGSCAAAAAVRRAVRVLHRGRHVGNGQGAGEHYYGAQLLGSIVLFTFFSEATSGAVRSVVDSENLVRKIQFPRLVIPLSVVLLALFNLGLNLIVVTDLRADRRRAADAQLARAAADPRDARGALRPASRCCSRRCSSTSATSSRSGKCVSQILFYASPVIIPVETVRRS